ncbi:MAG: choice-of-anchor D domain-containing protein, partial [Proteobacteria bacterium]|nr:choice-of-anchor D domain-containing protein [Pseudomonadota bacterium]
MKSRTTLALALLVCLFVPCLNAGAQSAQQYRVYELSFTSSAFHANPWITTVDFQCTFTHESGANFTVDGFCDGGKDWYVRFNPIYAGDWSWSTTETLANDSGLHGKSGNFTAAPASGTELIQQHGPMIQKVNDNGRRYFTYTDGTPFLMLGDINWVLLSDKTPWNSSTIPGQTNSFKYYFDARKSHGHNTMHTALLGKLEGYPHPRDWTTTINLNWMREAEKCIQYSHDIGMIFMLDMGNWEQLALSQNFDVQQMKYKYAMARWGAYAILWEAWHEFDHPAKNQPALQNAAMAVAEYIDSIDPYNRPVALFDTHNAFAATRTGPHWNKSWLGFILNQIGANDPYGYNNAKLKHINDNSYGNPVVGAEGRWETPTTGDHTLYQFIRTIMWGGAGYLNFAEGAWIGREDPTDDGHAEWESEPIGPPYPTLQDAMSYPGGSVWLNYVREFFEEEKWYEFDYKGLVNGSLDGDDTSILYMEQRSGATPEKYIVFFPKGQNTRPVNISAGVQPGMTYDVSWYEATTGVRSSGTPIVSTSTIDFPNRPGIEAQFCVLSSVPGIRNQPVSAITPSTATFNATLSSANTNFNVRVYWGTTDGGTNAGLWDNSAVVGSWSDVASINVSYLAESLPAETTYYYTFRATNGNEDVWGGPSVMFETISAPAVNNDSGAIPQVGQATLQGELTGGALADISVYWGTTDGGTTPGAWDNVNVLGEISEGTFSTDTASGLIYGARYYYRCYASNAVDDAWSASTMPFTTADPGSTLTNDQAADLTTTSATFNGTLGAAGSTFDIYVHWGTSDGGTTPAAWDNTNFIGSYTDVASQSLAFPASGLTPDQTYYYAFRAVNAATTLWGDPSTALKTLDTPAINNGIGATPFVGFATLNGSLTDGGQADVYVYWGTTDGGTTPSSWDNVIGLGEISEGTFSTDTAGGLTYGVQYYYRCYAINSEGQAWAPATDGFTTADPDTGLVGYWNFNNNDLVETSGYAQSPAGGSKAAGFYDGEVATGSVSYISGPFGKALDLTGGDNAVQVKNSTILRSFEFGDHTPADSTIAFWVKGWPGSAGVYGLVTRGFTRGGNHGLGVGVNNSPANASFKYGTTTINGTAGTLGDASWHHLAAVVDTAAGKSMLYVDGNLVNSGSIGAGTYYERDDNSDTRYIVFGADQMNTGDAISNFARLPLDEVRIYTRALTQAQVQELLVGGEEQPDMLSVVDGSFESPTNVVGSWGMCSAVWNDTGTGQYEVGEPGHLSSAVHGNRSALMSTMGTIHQELGSVTAGDTLTVVFYGGRAASGKNTDAGGVFNCTFKVGSASHTVQADTTQLAYDTWEAFTNTWVATESGPLTLEFSYVSGKPWIDHVSDVTIVREPEIAVEEPANNSLADGSSTRDFGFADVGISTQRIFTIRNVGTADLTGLAATFAGTNMADFSAGAIGATTLTPGASTTVTITFTPGTTGPRSATLRIASNDSDENPFDIALTGFGGAPDIAVEQAGQAIADGGSVRFDDLITGGADSTNVTLTIRNTGTFTLSGLATNIDGANAAEFSVSALGATTLDPGEDTMTTVTLNPASAGAKTAALHIASDDPDENPFDITLSGTVIEATTLESWADSYGLTGDDSLWDADGDGDSTTLLEEYGFNLDPNLNNFHFLTPGSGTSGLPSIVLDEDAGAPGNYRLRVEYLRRRGDVNLFYTVKFNTDLTGPWTSATGPETVTVIDETWERVVVEDSESTGT